MEKHEEAGKGQIISGKNQEGSISTLAKKAPQFFIIIFNGKRMGIPRKFVRKYGENISHKIFLEVPTGQTKWPVELAKNGDGRIWFEKGWEEFSDYFSICHGHFLVFRYEGNSTFHVIIFDTTASEIAYPFDPPAESTDDESVEIIDGFPLPQEANKRVKRAPDLRGMEENDDDDVSAKILEDNYSLSQEENPSASGSSKALERAEALKMKTKNPSSIIIMHPSYINPGQQISMKAEFVTKYFKQKRESVNLYISDDGRTWTVKQNGHRLYGGWKKFVLDNDLQVGDVCVLEMINRDCNSFKVTIFRAAED